MFEIHGCMSKKSSQGSRPLPNDGKALFHAFFTPSSFAGAALGFVQPISQVFSSCIIPKVLQL
jgi:hypothetical protein